MYKSNYNEKIWKPELNHIKTKVDYYGLLAKITFILYMFFAYYGTSLPFQTSTRDIQEISTSNIVNQIAFSTLFITALISLIPKWSEVIRLIKQEKFLTIFFIWGLMTIMWSSYSFVSFKRYFQVITTIVVCISALVHYKSSNDLIKIFKYLLGIYVVLSLISVFTIPGAKETYGPWRGLAKSKNLLGQIALFSILIWFASLRDRAFFLKFFNFFMLLLSIILLIGSHSFTDELTLFILFFSWIGLFLDKYLNVIMSKKILFTLIVFWGIGFIITILFVDPKWIGDFFSVSGRNLTFTGRTEIWSDILKIADKHLLFGCGFQGFWVIGSPITDQLYKKYIWIPLQAHNGYIDILNETGIIGLVLFILTFIKYFSSLVRYNKPHFWKWVVVSAIIINITESTFIRPQLVPGVMYIFGYLALMSDINKDEVSNSLKKLSP